MTSLTDSGEATQPSPVDVPWPTLATDQLSCVGTMSSSCAMPVSVGGHISPSHSINRVMDQLSVPVSTMPHGQAIQLSCVGTMSSSCAMPVSVGGHISPSHSINRVMDQLSVPVSTMPHGQAIQVMPAMSVSMTAFLLGMHVIQGVLGSFQLPPFIQTLSKDRPNGQGDRLFTLPPNALNVDNIKRFTPRRRHLKPKKLLKQLGADFDSFWMSVDLPDDLLETHVKHKLDTSLQEQLHTLNLTSLEHTLQSKFSIEKGSGDGAGDDGSSNIGASDMTSGVVDLVTSWLMQKASCPVYYRWEDLGLLYWPRWVRRGMCSTKDAPLKLASESASQIPKFAPCSWPPGMHCVPAKAKRLNILRWQCRNNKSLNNFNKFKLPGMMSPRSLPTTSENDMKKSQHAVDNQDLMKHLQKGLNISHQDVEQLETILNIAKKQTQDNSLHKSPGTAMSEHSEVVDKQQQKDTEKRDRKKTHFSHDKYKDTTSVSDNVKRGSSGDKTHKDAGKKKKNCEEDGSNDTENWSRMPCKERQRTLDLKCKWIKIPYPVTDNCFCSC